MIADSCDNSLDLGKEIGDSIRLGLRVSVTLKGDGVLETVTLDISCQAHCYRSPDCRSKLYAVLVLFQHIISESSSWQD